MTDNYSAIVVTIDNITKHPDADRLQITNIFGNTVIVGLNTAEGDRGLFFPLESQLGLEFAEANDLLRRKDAQGKSIGGMFDTNRRVRAQKLRGIPSMGFFIPLDSLNFLENVPQLNDGDLIAELNGITISTKYVPKGIKSRTANLGNVRTKSSRVICFPEHPSTAHFFRNLGSIPYGKNLIITTKMHGTSFRAGYVPVKRTLSRIERFLIWLGVNIQQVAWDYVYGSRKVIKDVNNTNQNHYYTDDIWTKMGKELFEHKLHKGEIVYGELVGFVPGGQEAIQKNYTYGCAIGECKAYIYRIAKANEDGILVDYSWEQVKQRALELGVEHVPEETVIPLKYRSKDEFTEKFKSTFLEKPCRWDERVPEEGVCIRIEGLYPEIYKAKSFSFLEMETKQLDNDETNIEDES